MAKINCLISQAVMPLQRLLAIVGSAESHSEHPIASAITSFVKQFLKTEQWAQITKFRASAGNGIYCQVGAVEQLLTSAYDISLIEKLNRIGASTMLSSFDVQVIQSAFNEPAAYANALQPVDLSTFSVVIGNERWLEWNGIDVDEQTKSILSAEQHDGNISVLCAINGVAVAVLSVADQVKSEASLAVYLLQKMGLNVVLLTGDNARTARATAKQVGIKRVYAEVLPNHKQAKIKQLQNNRQQKVAMVGDGVNDSPALATANVGIAIAAGSDVAIESAGIVLVKNDLLDVVVAIDLSKRTTNRIRWNFLFAIIYNAVSIPIAAGVFRPFGFAIQPWMAAAAMAMSSVSVVSSSLLLKLYKKPTRMSLMTREFYAHEAKLLLATDDDVIVQRGMDDMDMHFDPSSSMMSLVSTLRGSTQSMFSTRSHRDGRVQLLTSPAKRHLGESDALTSTDEYTDVSSDQYWSTEGDFVV
uniref:P-type Cu(+) transporter n=1 Tax=Plectus sambesii TaxID=2011161 RepID=A0A914UQF2_9BILA